MEILKHCINQSIQISTIPIRVAKLLDKHKLTALFIAISTISIIVFHPFKKNYLFFKLSNNEKFSFSDMIWKINFYYQILINQNSIELFVKKLVREKGAEKTIKIIEKFPEDYKNKAFGFLYDKLLKSYKKSMSRMDLHDSNWKEKTIKELDSDFNRINLRDTVETLAHLTEITFHYELIERNIWTTENERGGYFQEFFIKYLKADQIETAIKASLKIENQLIQCGHLSIIVYYLMTLGCHLARIDKISEAREIADLLSSGDLREDRLCDKVLYSIACRLIDKNQILEARKLANSILVTSYFVDILKKIFTLSLLANNFKEAIENFNSLDQGYQTPFNVRTLLNSIIQKISYNLSQSNDFNQAINLAQEIDNKEHREGAILEICRVFSKSEKIEDLRDIWYVLCMHSLEKRCIYPFSLFNKINEMAASLPMENCIQFVETIRNKTLETSVLHIISKRYLEIGDVKTAILYANLISGRNKDRIIRGEALRDICIHLLKNNDVRWAIELASSINDSNHYIFDEEDEKTLSEIADSIRMKISEYYSKNKQIDQAVEIFYTISALTCKSNALIEICKQLVHQGETQRMMKLIQEVSLSLLIEALNKENYFYRNIIGNMMTNDERENKNIFFAICSIVMLLDADQECLFNDGITMANLIDDDVYQKIPLECFCKIAFDDNDEVYSFYYKFSMSKALQAAHAIRDKISRTEVLESLKKYWKDDLLSSLKMGLHAIQLK